MSVTTAPTDRHRRGARPARALPWAGVAAACGLAFVAATVDQIRRGEGADTTVWLIAAVVLAGGACLAFGMASGTRWWALAWTAGWYVAAVLVSHAVGDLAGYNDRGPGTPIYMLGFLPVIVVLTAAGVAVSAARRGSAR